MKCEVTYSFAVNYTINNVSEQSGKTLKDIASLDSSNLEELYSELYSNGADDLESGDIKVDNEIYGDPFYDIATDSLYAEFCAWYSVVTEGKNKQECEEKAQTLFDKATCGDYEFTVGCDITIDTKIVAKEQNKNKEFGGKPIGDGQSR